MDANLSSIQQNLGQKSIVHAISSDKYYNISVVRIIYQFL